MIASTLMVATFTDVVSLDAVVACSRSEDAEVCGGLGSKLGKLWTTGHRWKLSLAPTGSSALSQVPPRGFPEPP